MRARQIDIIDDLCELLDEAYAHRVCLIAKPVELTSACVSWRHYLANVDS